MHQNIEVKGRVIKGDSIGHTIGFPTANLDQLPTETDLKTGVYTGVCLINETNATHDCLVYFGPRYISGKIHNSFEVHLLNFDGNLYGNTITVWVKIFIRPPIKMESLTQLKNQLQKDLERGRLLLNHG